MGLLACVFFLVTTDKVRSLAPTAHASHDGPGTRVAHSMALFGPCCRCVAVVPLRPLEACMMGQQMVLSGTPGDTGPVLVSTEVASEDSDEGRQMRILG